MKPTATDSTPGPTAAEDLAVLFPDADIPVRDPDSGESVTLTVREFRFLEGLRLTAIMRPFIEALGASASDVDVDEQVIAEAMADHAETWLACIAAATGRDVEWLGRLSDQDGQDLSAAMWSTNKDFFMRRLIEVMRRRRKAEPSPSPTSSMPSCGPDTDAGTATSPSG